MIEEEDENEFELVPSQVLIEELLSRCDSGIISLFKVQSEEEDASTYLIDRQWKGCPFTCMGIAADITTLIQRETDQETTEHGDNIPFNY